MCSCSEFSEMLVSYLGVDSPAVAQRLRLRAFWALRSRHTAVGGWAPAVRRRCRRLGGRACADARDGWRYTHDYIASTVFDLVSLAGISGTMEPRGIFSMAVAWLFRPRSWPRMVAVARGPALSQTIASRSTVVACCIRRNHVKRISFCPSRYWPTVAVASSRGGALEYRASLVHHGVRGGSFRGC